MIVKLERLPDWKPRLIELVNARASIPYEYGTNDCWLFVRSAVQTITGTLLFPEMRPYKGMIGAARLLIDNGWATPEDGITELVGEPIAAADTRPGDIVSYELCKEFHLAMRVTEEDVVSPNTKGLVIVEPNSWRKGWKVG